MMSNEEYMEGLEMFNLKKIRFGRQRMPRIDGDINHTKIFVEAKENRKGIS